MFLIPSRLRRLSRYAQHFWIWISLVLLPAQWDITMCGAQLANTKLAPESCVTLGNKLNTHIETRHIYKYSYDIHFFWNCKWQECVKHSSLPGKHLHQIHNVRHSTRSVIPKKQLSIYMPLQIWTWTLKWWKKIKESKRKL